jgi:hypothetical protein
VANVDGVDGPSTTIALSGDEEVHWHDVRYTSRR